MKLNQILKKAFGNRLRAYHDSLWKTPITNELDFIDRTVKGLGGINEASGRQRISSRSKRIHLSPQVRYYPYSLIYPKNNKPIEIGDILFIYKHFLDSVLDDYRGMIVQAKYNKGVKTAWRIHTNQFYFLAMWPLFEIVKPKFNKKYSIQPGSLLWGSYCFVGPNATKYPVYYSSDRMLRHRKQMPTTKSFTYNLLQYYSWDTSPAFLMRFIQGLIGEDLLDNQAIMELVDDIYKVMKWKPDPPGEPQWNDVTYTDEEGFGVVEFTVSSEGLQDNDKQKRLLDNNRF